MRALVLRRVVIALLLLAPVGRAHAQAPACAASEHRQFDFWIGNWDVFTPNGKAAGTNLIEKVAGGCGLRENWRGAGGGTGTSLNFWSPEDRKWHQTWVGTGGSFLFLSGGLVDGRMVLSGTTRDTSGAVQMERISWTPSPDSTVRQQWDQSRDDGKTWTTAFLGIYRRKK